MKPLVTSACVFLLMLACSAPKIRDALPKLTPTAPEEPQTDFDVLMQLAIRRAVVDEKAVPDYGLLPDPHRIVIWQRDSTITPRGLPHSSDVQFLLLTREQIRDLADRHGHFVYLIVGIGPIDSDSAQAGASTTWAGSKRNPSVVYMSGGTCVWQYRKHDRVWRYEKTFMCLIH